MLSLPEPKMSKVDCFYYYYYMYYISFSAFLFINIFWQICCASLRGQEWHWWSYGVFQSRRTVTFAEEAPLLKGFYFNCLLGSKRKDIALYTTAIPPHSLNQIISIREDPFPNEAWSLGKQTAAIKVVSPPKWLKNLRSTWNFHKKHHSVTFTWEEMCGLLVPYRYFTWGKYCLHLCRSTKSGSCYTQ